MGQYTLYKRKQYVKAIVWTEIPKEVKDFFDTYENTYIEDRETLKEMFSEEEEAQFKIVEQFYDDYELWGFDIDWEY